MYNYLFFCKAEGFMYFPTPVLNVLSLTPGIATLDVLFSNV